MKPLRLTASNLLSYDSLDLSFPSGLVGVCGFNKDNTSLSSNGSGKSAIFDILSWVLYGKPIRPIELSDMLRRGNTQGSAAFTFEVRHKKYLVNRVRDNAKSSLELYQVTDDEATGDNLTSRLITDTQEKINSILGIDYKTFCLMFVFSPDLLRFAGATGSDQKAAIERIIGSQNLDVAHGSVKDILKKAKSSSEQLKMRSASNEATLRSCDSHMANVKKEIDGLVTEIDRLQNENLEVNANLVKQKEAQLSDLKVELEEFSKASDLIKAKSVESYALTTSMSRNIEAKRRLEEKLQLTKAKRPLFKIGDPCGFCGRLTADSEREHIEKVVKMSLSDNQDLVREYRDEIGKLDSSIKIDMADKAVADQESASLNECGKLIHQTKSKMLAAEVELMKLKEQLAKPKEDFNAKISSLQSILDGLLMQRKKIEEESAAIAAELKENSDLILALEFWDRGFGPNGIRAIIMQKFLDNLIELANQHLGVLSGNTISLDVNYNKLHDLDKAKERIDLQVRNLHGAGTYRGCSGGERQRIDIAIAMALYDLSIVRCQSTERFLIFDEIFERMDEAGCEATITLLKKRKDIGSIYFISHNPNVLQFVDKKIEVEKINGASRIVSVA